MSTHRFSRRTMLRGIGVTMALPWLESLNVWGDVVRGAEVASEAPVRLVDKFNNVLEDFGPMTIFGAGPSHSVVIPTLAPQKMIRIQWGDNWNTGIDNIHFTQVLGAGAQPQHVPEPGLLALLAAASIPAALALRRKR